VTRGFKSHLQHERRIMSQDKKFVKIVLHISEELNERIENASAKNKLAINSVIREALHKYLEESEKKK